MRGRWRSDVGALWEKFVRPRSSSSSVASSEDTGLEESVTDSRMPSDDAGLCDFPSTPRRMEFFRRWCAAGRNATRWRGDLDRRFPWSSPNSVLRSLLSDIQPASSSSLPLPGSSAVWREDLLLFVCGSEAGPLLPSSLEAVAGRSRALWDSVGHRLSPPTDQHRLPLMLCQSPP